MERRQTRLARQLMRATGLMPAVPLVLGLGLVLAGGGPDAPPQVPVAMDLHNANALDEAATRPLVALPAGAVPMAGLWFLAGGLGWAGLGVWRAGSAVRAASRGEVREARVTAHARAGRRRGGWRGAMREEFAVSRARGPRVRWTAGPWAA